MAVPSVMMVAAEPSGDLLAAELVAAWKRLEPEPPRFFGAGGPRMAEAGVTLAFDLTQHAIIGVPSLGDYFKFRRFRDELVRLAFDQKPALVLGIDAFAFNGSVAAKLRHAAPRGASWTPRLAHYVSPQVWASRPKRAARLEAIHDVLISILPFEPQWYGSRAPKLRVEFVGHPLVDRCGGAPPAFDSVAPPPKELLLLPGSRSGELRRHIPVMAPAGREASRRLGLRLRMILPNERLESEARGLLGDCSDIVVQSGGLREALAGPVVAAASTGTVTLECAWHGAPTVALYKASPATYWIGRRIVTVRHLAMPNLLAGGLADPPDEGFRPVMPELIQGAATPEALTEAIVELAGDPERYRQTRRALLETVLKLGKPGASLRAAQILADLMRAPQAGPPGP